MSEKGIQIHKFQDGNEAVVVEFGFGKIGIGLDDNCARNLAVHLQELNEPKDMGAFLTREELEDNFNKPSNPLEVILGFPDVKSIDNFIETLKIYRQKVFFPERKDKERKKAYYAEHKQHIRTYYKEWYDEQKNK